MEFVFDPPEVDVTAEPICHVALNREWAAWFVGQALRAANEAYWDVEERDGASKLLEIISKFQNCVGVPVVAPEIVIIEKDTQTDGVTIEGDGSWHDVPEVNQNVAFPAGNHLAMGLCYIRQTADSGVQNVFLRIVRDDIQTSPNVIARRSGFGIGGTTSEVVLHGSSHVFVPEAIVSNIKLQVFLPPAASYEVARQGFNARLIIFLMP